MYTERTAYNRFAIQDLLKTDLELIMDGLIVLKEKQFKDTERFNKERKRVIELYQQMRTEIRTKNTML